MKSTLLGISIAACLAIPALADWFPGEPHKMHYPQMPDPNGWDINVRDYTIADDWQCSQTGTVSDVHFWLSWDNDAGDPNMITGITVSIHSNIPVGPQGWSVPDELLWIRTFIPGQFNFLPYGSGPQGFIREPGFPLGPPPVFDPPPDHNNYWQINIQDIVTPFVQQQNEIYWLDLRVQTLAGSTVGWKTSLDHFMDDAVWFDQVSNQWIEIRDPLTLESLDMAFVIVPEPSPALFGLVGIVLLLFRRRDR
jgi:hypothetical protein